MRLNRRFAALAFFAASAAFFALADAPPQIHGFVTDANGNPVADALIEWSKFQFQTGYEAIDSTRTDANGEYTITLSECDDGFRLSATKDSYAPAFYEFMPPWVVNATFEERIGTPIPQPEHNFTLEPEHTLDGVVVDEQGNAIADAVVTARTSVEGINTSFSMPSYPMPIPGKGIHKDTTDAEGKFHLNGLPSGKVSLNVEAPHRHVNDGNYSVDTPCTVKMSGSGQPGAIRARVVNEANGKPVTAFVVSRRHVPAQMPVSDRAGEFTLEDLTQGSAYEIHVYADGFAPWSSKVIAQPIDADMRTAIALHAAPSLHARLVDANTRKPIAKAPVLFADLSESRYWLWNEMDGYIDGMHNLTTVQRATSDANGAFWFAEDAQKPGGIIVVAPGYARAFIRSSDRPAPAADGTVELALTPEAVVTGTVLEFAAPDSPNKFQIWKKSSTPYTDETFENAGCDATARFTFRNLEPGEYTLGIARPSGRFSTIIKPVTNVTLRAGDKADVTAPLREYLDKEFFGALASAEAF